MRKWFYHSLPICLGIVALFCSLQNFTKIKTMIMDTGMDFDLIANVDGLILMGIVIVQGVSYILNINIWKVVSLMVGFKISYTSLSMMHFIAAIVINSVSFERFSFVKSLSIERAAVISLVICIYIMVTVYFRKNDKKTGLLFVAANSLLQFMFEGMSYFVRI